MLVAYPFTSQTARTSTSKTCRYCDRAYMALELSDNDLVDLEAPLTPPPSMNSKRCAESPHPNESSSKRVLMEDAYTGADAEDSDDEFVDAEEEITADYNGADGAYSSAAFDLEDLVNIDDLTGANGQMHPAQLQTEGFSGDQLEQYDYGAQDQNDFSDILGPHGYGNGLTEEEIEAQGITAEQHLAFTNGLTEHDEQRLDTEPSELPTREEWSHMSAAEQDEFLNTASSDAEDEPMFTTHAQHGVNEAAFFSSTLGDELQPNGLPVEQCGHEAINGGVEEGDAQLGAQHDSLDDENLFSTTFGDHTDVLTDDDDDDEEDQSRQQPQGFVDEPSHEVIHPSGMQPTNQYNQRPTTATTTSSTSPKPTKKSSHPSPAAIPRTSTVTSTNNPVNKTSASTPAQRIADLSRLSIDAPTLPRDLSKSLRAFHKFHTRVLHLIPRLPNWSSFPSRRYWIAVLHLEKKPNSSSLSEKDFLWMKGNRFSTISTIWHSYQTRSMCDPEDFVLVARGEVMEMGTKAEEMDGFGEKLVVLRAMRKGKARESVAKSGGLLGGFGVVPEKMAGEVIELD
ncbi:hypothetical protein AC579_8141 [Pseudocercospora musae]|uniref:Uncharacterized protein n=1 Tax=Pseudocercospora musae TaxID=113226 RepID=A0A139IUI3_9PEZI|nr:hypothetical protein AC579_8141 [Pseudocercospora musae]